MADLTAEQKIALITVNLQETLKQDIIENIIVKENRPLTIYWGTYTTNERFSHN